MKIADVLPDLGILPLRRFAEAWEVETIKSAKRDVFEQAIVNSIARIDTDSTVRQRLATFQRQLDHVRRTNAETVLRLVLDEPAYVVTDEGELIKSAVAVDAAFFQYAQSKTATRHLDPRSVDIYQSVLEVAWQNGVSFEEYQLLRRLRAKLNINRRDHRVMEVRIVGVSPVGPQEAEQALRDLNYHGFVGTSSAFRCSQARTETLPQNCLLPPSVRRWSRPVNPQCR